MIILLEIDFANSITLPPHAAAHPISNRNLRASIRPCLSLHTAKYKKVNRSLPTSNHPPDGSCLFNSIFVLLSVSERLTFELRLRAFKYLVENFVELNLLTLTEDSAIICSPNVLQTIKSAVKTYGWGSHFTIKPLDNVIGAQIAVLYPSVCPDDLSKILMKTYYPKMSRTSGQLNLMCTNMSTYDFETLTSCNHFVPLIFKNLIDNILKEEECKLKIFFS